MRNLLPYFWAAGPAGGWCARAGVRLRPGRLRGPGLSCPPRRRGQRRPRGDARKSWTRRASGRDGSLDGGGGGADHVEHEARPGEHGHVAAIDHEGGWRSCAWRRSVPVRVEGVWSVLKMSLASLTKHNLGQLTRAGQDPAAADAVRPGPPDGFLAKTGLDLSNPGTLKIVSRWLSRIARRRAGRFGRGRLRRVRRWCWHARPVPSRRRVLR